MKRLLPVVLGVWLGWAAGPAAGQDLGGGDFESRNLPDPPASRVLDEAGLFGREPARLEALSRRLKELDRDFGWPVYLAIYSSLLEWSPEDQATALRQAWAKNPGEGLVVVYESDTRLVAFGRPLETAVASDGSGQRLVGRVAAYELDEMIRLVLKEAGEKNQRTDQVEALMMAVARELEASLSRKRQTGFDGNHLRFALIVVGGISVIALIALVAARLIGRSERRRRRVHRLPEVEVGQRLGAPYGGGRVMERSFRGNGGARGGSGPAAGGGAG